MPLAPLPQGSRIRCEELHDGLRVVLPAPRPWWRWLPVLFLLGWLGGWACGVAFASFMLWTILQADTPLSLLPASFVALWLVLWTIGGLTAARAVRHLAWPLPETIKLSNDALEFDIGSARLGGFPDADDDDAEKDATLRLRRKAFVERGTLGRRELAPIAIRFERRIAYLLLAEGDATVRLGYTLGEPELEWLQGVLEAWRTGRLEP